MKFESDLAIIDTEDKIKLILDYMHQTLIYESCSWLFIGLKREEWIIPKKGTGSKLFYYDLYASV